MWGASARARVHAPFPYLANGWMDCIEIWCVSSHIHYIITLDKCGTHVWGGVHLHVRTCTPRFRDLANGWANCVQILCVNSYPLDKSFTYVWAGVHLHSARAHVHTPVPYLASGWADCVQILCVNRDPIDKCFTNVWSGVHLHVRTCTPFFHILQTAGRIASKFGVWLWIHDGSVLHMSEAGVHLRVRTCRSIFHTGNTNNQPSVRSATPKALPRR